MASFTYTVWTNESATAVLEKLRDVFNPLGFSLINPQSGKCHLWNEEGECSSVDAGSVQTIEREMLPLGIQWWRGDEDIFVTLTAEDSVGGTTSSLRLVGMERSEQAEIARQLILRIVPEKGAFPDDMAVFRLGAQ